jgi:hypothetical protein
LRNVTKRLEKVARHERLLILIGELERSERRSRHALARVKDAVQQGVEDARTDLFHKRVGDAVRRASEKLGVLLQIQGADSPVPRTIAELRAAVLPRLARRAAGLKAAISAAGSVYLAGRLKAVRADVIRLRFASELAADVGAGATLADVRMLARIQALLMSLGDTQALIDYAREVQGSLATPDVKAWRDLDVVILALENRCRTLHARYVRERESLVHLCERLGSRVPAASATRKAS